MTVKVILRRFSVAYSVCVRTESMPEEVQRRAAFRKRDENLDFARKQPMPFRQSIFSTGGEFMHSTRLSGPPNLLADAASKVLPAFTMPG